jgi:hypothetical protein
VELRGEKEEGKETKIKEAELRGEKKGKETKIKEA